MRFKGSGKQGREHNQQGSGAATSAAPAPHDDSLTPARANGKKAAAKPGTGNGVADAKRVAAAKASANGNGNGAPSARAATATLERNGRLGEVLVEQDLVTGEQLEEALEHAIDGTRLGEALLGIGALDERHLVAALAKQFDLEIADLRRERPDPDALSALPEANARELVAVPMHRRGDVLEIAVADPARPGMVDELSRAVNGPVRLLVAPASEVRRVIDQSYRALSRVARHVREFELLNTGTRDSGSTVAPAVDGQAPVVQVVNLIVTQALRDRASDVHIEPMGDQVRVRMRVDGALHDALTLPADMGPAIVSRIKVMSGMNIVERRRAQDGQFETSVDGRALDVRVATTPVIHGEKTVMRLLDKSRSLYALGELGMPPYASAVFSDLLRSPFGMVLCAGPTGSGKTTTLYAALSEINTTERNIMTVEDPVEYVMPTVNQMQINETADVTFAGGLKSILRQDPDVILVGEVRDVETARIAVQSALTGHFVLSSIHATDAASAVHRFLDMGIEPFLIAPSVLAVVGQRLVRRICRECATPYKPTVDEIAFYESIGGARKDEFWHGEGCNFCSGTGFQERIGVYEILRMSDAMRELVVNEPAYSDLRRLAIDEGMHPLRDEALRLVAEDVTTIPEILRSVYPL